MVHGHMRVDVDVDVDVGVCTGTRTTPILYGPYIDALGGRACVI